MRYFVHNALKADGAYEQYSWFIIRVDTADGGAIMFLAENGRSKGKTVEISEVIQIYGNDAYYGRDL